MGKQACSPRLVARSKELGRLREALERATAGLAVVIVAGETGVGKTRLVSEFISRTRAAGTTVLVGGCVPVASGGLPYAPIMEALRCLSHELGTEAVQELAGSAPGEFAHWVSRMDQGDLTGDGHGSNNEPAQTSLFGFLLGLLGQLGRDGPVLLVVEDVHWADPSTLDLLIFLVRNLQREAVALVVTYRNDELHHAHPLRFWLAELKRSAKVESLELQRLDRNETSEQLTEILGSPPNGTAADGIFARSEGNPFFTEKLVSMRTADGNGALPADLRDMLLAKVYALSKPAQSALGIAAAAGHHVSHELLCHVAGAPEGQLDAALREAVDRQILVVDPEGGSYAFRHKLLQEAAYSDLLPGERQRLHNALAQALTNHPELAAGGRATAHAELAHHWYAVRNLPAALGAGIRAGLAAEEACRFPEALRQFHRALELWDQVPNGHQPIDLDRPGLLVRAAEAARRSGEPDRAVALIREALELVDDVAQPVRAGMLYERLGCYHLSCGDHAAASDAYQQALRLIPGEPPSAERASVLVAIGRLSMFLARYRQARASCEKAIGLARKVGARLQEGRALKTLGFVTAHSGELDMGIEYLRQALSIAEEVHDPTTLAGSYVDLSHLLGVAGRLEETVQVALDGRRVARRLGLEHRYGSLLEANAAGALFELGRWEEATQLLTAAAARQDLSGIREMAVLSESIKLAIAQGDFARAHQQINQAAHLCNNTLSPIYHRKLLEPRAELAIWEGRLDDACSMVADALRLLAQSEEQRFAGSLFMLGLRAQADRAELARARRGDADAATAQQAGRALLEQAGRLLANPLDPAASGLPESAALAATCEAERSRLDGRSNPELWTAAVAHWDNLGRPYSAAYARWRQAEACLAAGGMRHQAGPVLRRAHEVAMHLQARPLHHELELLARRARIDLQRFPTQTQPMVQEPSPADQLGLTPREVEVLQYLSSGCSNRQIAQILFISSKTVSVHVSHILHKLGIQSRVEAAGIAYRLGLVSPSRRPS